ncbi:multimerin-2-like [Oreochromis aureus]|uniref:C1q domain-containing protein n=1 Tax=Oreochromis aureus TaxID=47969 RepID=A0AAZ1XAS4_OREAU|nr:multimerin-2-like [Oreochromis aureus]
MEIMVFFSLLLLVCSVSTNQTEADNEILDQQISNQQAFSQDIHAVLRELTASVAVQKVEIRTLKQENQDQEAKLERQKTETDQLKLQSKEQEAKLESQKTEIDQLKLESEEQVAKLETEIDKLKQELQVKQVAFSASLVEQGSRETGPFNTQITLIFKRVVTNIGNAYNKHTGIFTAPVRGVYHFDWSVHGYGNIPVGGVLFRNGEHIFVAYESQTSGSVTASNGASLLLEVGDQVSVRLWEGARIYDNHNHLTTFSGHLIFTL